LAPPCAPGACTRDITHLCHYLGRIFALMLGWLCLPDCLALILAHGRLAPGRLVRVVAY
jgi:hypothetical protein